MRKRTQRISAILLSLAMVLTALPFHLVYADTDTAADAPVADEVKGKTDAQENAKEASEQASSSEKKDTEAAEQKDAAKKSVRAKAATEEKIVTIKSVKVAYVNGKPLEDGHLITIYRSDKSDNGTDYEVKDGKISNLKLVAGVPYKIGISMDDDMSWDYELAYSEDLYVRVAVREDSTKLLKYDRAGKKITDTPVTKLVVKEYDTEDPIPQGKEVKVADIPVVYEDGTPVPDDENMELDLMNMQKLMDNGWGGSYSTRYKVKGGKISGVKMDSEVQYKIGFDTANPFWHTHDVVGAYNSSKLMRIYARYDGKLPLEYDYDEGINAPEKEVEKIVVKKSTEVKDPCATPSSCWAELLLSDKGYYAESGFTWKATRLDNGKTKTLYNREGSLTIIGEANVEYLLTLEENDTYEIDFDSNPIYKKFKDRGGIPFHFTQDSNGKWHAVLEGYSVEDAASRLNYNYIDLKRIDGKQNNTNHKFSDDECGDSQDVKSLYTKDVVALKGMKVDEVSGSTQTPLKKDVNFVFYDSTTQTIEAKVTAKDGVLPDVPMYKGHRYIVYAQDSQYEMPNYYIQISADGKAVTYKNGNKEVSGFYMKRRAEDLAKPEDAARVQVKLPVYYVDKDGNQKTVSGVKVRLVNQYDTVEAVSDADGNIDVTLMEDYNYMVLVDDEKYSIESFPLTVKDKSEYGWGKYTFNHFSCGSISSLFLVDKGTEHDRDVQMIGSSNNTTVTGLNFGNGSYFINDRVVDRKVKELEGEDYEVVDVDAVNMYRTEISKLSAGDFVYTRVVPEGKKVSKVYYIDDNDRLHELEFTESNGVVTFKMGSVSLYDNVIVYAAEKLQTKGVSLSKTAYTYSGKAKRPAVTVTFDGKKLKAGSDYTVSYSANKNVGKAKVTVTGKGKYEGTITKTFKINPKGTSIKHLKKGVRAFKPTWKKQIKQISGYQVQYSTKKSFKSAKIKNVSSKKKSTWVIKQKRHKKYYVRIRTYKKVDGSKYYSNWSSAKSIKTK